jgi:polar amino acid transport system substrate-binding protein
MRTPVAATARLGALLVLSALGLCQLGGGPARAADPRSPDAALAQLLDAARTEAASSGACARTDIDRLTRAFCRQQLRVGVRNNYPLFGTSEGGIWSGYDIAVARMVATKLALPIAFAEVSPANRIAALAHDQVDLLVATLGHNTARDGQVRFIRPHYYESETILVGPRAAQIKDWSDIGGKLICVTIGDGANAQSVSHRGRLMLFDDPAALIAGLNSGTCPLAAQDDSFFASYFLDPPFASRFDRKLGFAPVPWGMAVARDGSSERLAAALDAVSQILHRDGVFLKIAQDNRVDTPFLEQQRQVWNRPECNVEGAAADPACVLPALDMQLEPTRFAPSVAAFEHWLADTVGLSVALPMLELAPAWSLFMAGVLNSLVLVAGALIATLFCALTLAAAHESRSAVLRLAARTIIVVMQSSPTLLSLVIAAAICRAVFPYSGAMALCAAILAIGLTNGSNAGQAIAEALASLRAERRQSGHGPDIFAAAVRSASTQIVSFLVNAAKATPAASFIGAPELLNSLTDITSFSANGRGVTYALVLVFYIGVIGVVIASCKRLEARLARRLAPS